MPAVQDPQLVLVRLLAQADRLYSLPTVAMQVLELTRNPQIDTWALKACIENDPALTGKILRVVNSSLFGLGSPVSDLHQALALLGTKPLKLLVLGFSLPPALFSGVSADVLGRYWRHTLTRAVVARELFEQMYDAPGDEAFLAGLLRDLGILLLIQQVGEPYIRLLSRVQAAGSDLAERETEAMGFDHRELSFDLLAHWGLPEPLVQAVARRRDPASPPQPDEPSRPLADTVEAAEWFARLLVDGNRQALGKLFELPAGRQLRRFRRDELLELVDNFEIKICQLADILSLTLPEGRDYRQLLAEAHEQLAVAAADAAEELIARAQPARSNDFESALAGAVESLATAAASLTDPAVADSPAGESPITESLITAECRPAEGSVATIARPLAKPQAGPSDDPTTACKPGLLHHLSIAAAACRQCRRPLSLLLVQFDRCEKRQPATGAEQPMQQFPDVRAFCDELDCPGAACLPFGNAGFALVLPDCDRNEAVEWGHRLIDRATAAASGGYSVQASVGVASVAMPPKNFAHETLLSSADRCLYGARASGRSTVKSIEI